MSDLPATGTLLLLNEIGVTLYSARGLTQTLSPIAASIKLERDVNGILIDLSVPAMRKYASKITCTDNEVPALSGVWPGMVVTVSCVCELSFLTANPAMQQRPAVAGSIRTDGLFTFYRPILVMKVTEFRQDIEEYAGHITSELSLEEQ